MIKKILNDVFSYKEGEVVTILFDFSKKSQNLNWIWRQELAKKWSEEIDSNLVSYNATNANNADLPNICFFKDKEKSFDEIFSKSDIVIALTEFSATAPLHKFSKKYNLRVASMPGFNQDMIPAMELEFNKIKKKVDFAYKNLQTEKLSIDFEVENRVVTLNLDLRNRIPLKDDGDCTKSGVINLPTGEAFIAPNDSSDSKSYGIFPIEINGQVNFYKIEKNHIVSAEIDDELIKRIKEDRAIGNIAEFAYGVLGEFGIKPCGKVLLDEKLGIHIALGRSDHFGGCTGPDSFKKKENVWHQDFVYIKELQPKIKITKIRTTW